MFCALPASGKSESRRFFKSLTPEEMAQFHLGDSSTQVDDYPYVDALEKIDVFCKETLGTTVFKDPNTRLFLNGYEWGVLTYLINEDYLDIKKLDKKIPEEYESDPVKWLFKRYDDASEKTGKVPRRFEELEKKSDKDKFNEFKKNVMIYAKLSYMINTITFLKVSKEKLLYLSFLVEAQKEVLFLYSLLMVTNILCHYSTTKF